MKFEPDVADLSLSIDECDVGVIIGSTGIVG